MNNMRPLRFPWAMVAALAGAGVVGTVQDAAAVQCSTRVGPGLVDVWHDQVGTIEVLSDTILDCHRNWIRADTQMVTPCCYNNGKSPLRCGIFGNNVQRVQVRNCFIAGTGPGGSNGFVHGMVFVGGGGITVTDSISWFNSRSGLYAAYAVYGDTNNPALTVHGSDLSWNLLGVETVNVGHTVISFNWLWWNGADGADLERANGVIIANNTIYGNHDHGIEIDDGFVVDVLENWVDGNVPDGATPHVERRDGLQLQRISDVDVWWNDVIRSGRHGIYFHDSDTGTLFHNTAQLSNQVVQNPPETGYDCRNNDGAGFAYLGNNFTTSAGCQ